MAVFDLPKGWQSLNVRYLANLLQKQNGLQNSEDRSSLLARLCTVTGRTDEEIQLLQRALDLDFDHRPHAAVGHIPNRPPPQDHVRINDQARSLRDGVTRLYEYCDQWAQCSGPIQYNDWAPKFRARLEVDKKKLKVLKTRVASFQGRCHCRLCARIQTKLDQIEDRVKGCQKYLGGAQAGYRGAPVDDRLQGFPAPPNPQPAFNGPTSDPQPPPTDNDALAAAGAAAERAEAAAWQAEAAAQQAQSSSAAPAGAEGQRRQYQQSPGDLEDLLRRAAEILRDTRARESGPNDDAQQASRSNNGHQARPNENGDPAGHNGQNAGTAMGRTEPPATDVRTRLNRNTALREALQTRLAVLNERIRALTMERDGLPRPADICAANAGERGPGEEREWERLIREITRLEASRPGMELDMQHYDWLRDELLRDMRNEHQ